MNSKSQSKSPHSPLQAYMVAMAGHLLIALARRVRNEELSLVEYGAMHLLRRGPPLRINELAEQLDQPLPAASRTVSSLVDKGLVNRVEDGEDRRAKLLTLTPKGRSLIDDQASELVKEVGAALAAMDNDIAKTVMPIYRTFVSKDKPD
jgi:DNA-binding MarR family transcriptional regulator